MNRIRFGFLLMTASMIGCGTRADSTSTASGDPGSTVVSTLDDKNISQNSVSTEDQTVEQMRQERVALDSDTWKDEVAAQKYEAVFVRLWDRLRVSDRKIEVLADFAFQQLSLPKPSNSTNLELGIRRVEFQGPTDLLAPAKWKELAHSLVARGYRIVETEWHHSRFKNGEPPQSEISFALHAEHQESRARFIVRGELHVDWSAANGDQTRAQTVSIRNMHILARSDRSGFRPVLKYSRRQGEYASAHPIIVYDLDGNGYPEIVISRWNRVYWNEGKGKFREGVLLKHYVPIAESGLLADFTGDGAADFLTVSKEGSVLLFAGTKTGEFNDPHIVVSSIVVPSALAMTAGDIDGDNDLDVWVTQYKPSYEHGQMPTPYYDANDGEPSYLLKNDGHGQFLDATKGSGLERKRFRRTYSSSLVDLDDDSDLDLVVVSDYAGVDMYQNDGRGAFHDISKSMIGERHLFGMAHTFGDYNVDGTTDFYAIGMSSTTARRLDQLGLGRDDRPDIHAKRRLMGYGNRMYLRSTDSYIEPTFANRVARTGWSWGTTSFDFDLDGDEDIYVANGFRSGESCRDYCTKFWRHDIYTGSSQANAEVASLFSESMRDLNAGMMSWNGYEHNALLLNLDGQDFENVGFLFDVACEYDSRAVVGNDLDGDGKPDLMVAEYSFVGQGFELDLNVYQNTLSTGNHWIGFRLRELGDGFSPVGAEVILHAGGRRQIRRLVTGDSFLSQHANVAHFGLGKTTEVESATVIWPNGKVTEIGAPEIDRYHDVTR